MNFFQSAESLLRVLIVAVPAYLGLVLILRVAGKRTLSKMNAFDLVVTVALGSVLANTLLSPDVPVANGVLAMAVLVALQLAITWTSVRVPGFQRLIKATPRLLAFRGALLPHALRRERVTEAEVEAAIRQSGLAGLDSTYAVVLETDGTLTVIPRMDDADPSSALDHVAGIPR